ncbi:hypothetical protein BFW38_15585 [Terasakiispira papahanaumokuakeensis]|uniref:Uncharacterized protein n=1 Tax=Terasakiispira papahanaumokuakeensis TaxID=197479 RepID=A0A1E2VCL4_9GAMM|nr:hypothetical protein [Terasakiispira papahanaumokuakeensis]ODC04739.1 hypothetical protein BFW38_15585 [Terasakiispira papahanaumokuakeensis]
MTDLYRFDVKNGQVTGYMEWDDGRWEPETIEADERFTVEGSSIIREEQDDGHIEITRYEATDDPGVYREVSETSRAITPEHDSAQAGHIDPSAQVQPGASAQTPIEDSLKVEMNQGQITGIQEMDDGQWETKHLDPDERLYLNNNGDLVLEDQEDGGVEINVYRDANGDGIYQPIAERFESGGADMTMNHGMHGGDAMAGVELDVAGMGVDGQMLM